MLGVLCIFSQGTGDAINGIIYGLLSGFGFALLTVLLRLYKGRNPVQTMAFNNLLVALVLLPWVWDSLMLTPKDAVLMLIMGVIQLGGPYVMYAFALRRVLDS